MTVKMTSKQIQDHYGRFAEIARREPVIHTHHGREILVTMAIDEARALLAPKPAEAKEPKKRNALFDLAGKGRKYSIYKSDEDIVNFIRAMRDEGP